jgi:RND family efflux transporter MFP subunit
MQSRIFILFVAGAALSATIGITACNSGSGSSQADAAVIPSATVATVQRGNISQVLTLAGQFQPYQMIDVHPKVSGFIRHIYVDIGDRVHQGETLAVLEVPELAAQLQGTVSAVAQSGDEITRAQHEVARAESEHAALHADYQRLADTSKAQPGLVAQQELDDAQAKDLSSEAQVDAAKAALAAARNGAAVAKADNQRVSAMQNYTRVVAPLDGVIVWRYADTGALIQAGTSSDVQSLPIVRLSQSGLLRLRVPVPEDDVQFVHDGDEMQVWVGALNRSFTGKVVRFTRNLNLETRTMETEIDVENKDLTLDPGMYANTQLQLAHVENVLTLPVEALVQQGRHETVLAVGSDNRVHVRQVTVGLQGSLLAEIRGGLVQGDRVILGGQEKYHDGEQITPVPTKTAASEVARQSGGMIDLHDDQSGSQGGTQ